jgi:hypothetical protein
VKKISQNVAAPIFCQKRYLPFTLEKLPKNVGHFCNFQKNFSKLWEMAAVLQEHFYFQKGYKHKNSPSDAKNFTRKHVFLYTMKMLWSDVTSDPKTFQFCVNFASILRQNDPEQNEVHKLELVGR